MALLGADVRPVFPHSNFAGFGRELFTDTGQYVLRFEGVIDELNPRLEAPAAGGALPEPSSASSAGSPLSRGVLRDPEPSTAVTERKQADETPRTPPSLPLDHRAVLLATAICESSPRWKTCRTRRARS